MSTPKSFSLFLALRYLKPKRTFLSIITLISILGVTLGVMVLILVISVMTGFEQELQQKVIGFDAHIVVSNGAVLDNWTSMQEEIHKIPGVEAVAPFALGPVLVQHENRRMAPKIRGIDPDKEREITDIKKHIIDGHYDLDGEKTVIGSELARQLNAKIGDKITVFSPSNMDDVLNELERIEKDKGTADASALRQMILPLELEVTGIFESGRYLYDSEFLIVPLHIGQEVYDLGGSVHGLAIRTSDPFKAEEIKKTLNQMLGESAFAQTWIDMNKQIFDAIRTERSVMFFILMFIILVAAFGIMNTLITVTVQKTREIGIMKALGAQTFQIISVFLSQGVVIGFFGTLTGLLTGITLVQYRNQLREWLYTTFHINVFPADIYQFNDIPAKIVPSDVALICICAFLICATAALIPAYFAARLDPVKALRYE